MKSRTGRFPRQHEVAAGAGQCGVAAI